IAQSLREAIPDLAFAVKHRHLELVIECCPFSGFEVAQASGKTRPIVDRRNYSHRYDLYTKIRKLLARDVPHGKHLETDAICALYSVGGHRGGVYSGTPRKHLLSLST